MYNNLLKIFFVIFFAISCGHHTAASNSTVNKNFNVGFFLGGRTGTFFRLWDNRQSWLKDQLNVRLLTKDIRQNDFYFVEKAPEKIDSKWSKATGDELIDLVLLGKADSALIGETAFIKMVHKKIPLIAIAETGHDLKGKAGHAMVFRSGIDLKNPKSWKGLTFGARRSAGGDLIVLKEFLLSEGLDPYKDVKIVDQIDDDKMYSSFERGLIDASYVHLSTVRSMIEQFPDKFQVYKALDWINPEISQALLVVNANYLKENRSKLKELLNTYSRFIVWEKALPKDKRKIRGARGIQLEEDFMGMDFPQSYDCPYIRKELLVEWQKVLVRHKVVPSELPIDSYIDNSLFECEIK